MYSDSKLTLLTEEQLKNNQFEVLKKYGFRATMTDLAIVRGLDIDKYKYVSDDKNLKERVGLVLLQSNDDNIRGFFLGVMDNDEYYLNDIDFRCGGIRPVLKLSSSKFLEISKNKISRDGISEVWYGEYPQYAPNEGVQKMLSHQSWLGNLKKTGKSYTFDGAQFNDKMTKFRPTIYDEYEYEGKKYIYVDSNIFGYNEYKLSNGQDYVFNSSVWIEISPVKWLVDENTETLISKNILLSGIRYLDVKNYLDNYMLKDLFQTSRLVNVDDVNLENKNNLSNNEDEQKEKLVDLLHFLKESGLELTEEQEKIINFVDNKELREKRQREIRDDRVLENQRKEEWFNSLDNPSNIRLEQLRKMREQVEILKKIQQKNSVLLSSEQRKLIEYFDMVDLANSMPHEIDTGMDPEIRKWYNEKYGSESQDVKTR